MGIPLTTSQLLALTEDGMERWLIAGELRERPATLRDRLHSRTFVCAGTELVNWRRRQRPPRRTDETELIDGVPILAVEILSPSETLEDIHETTPFWPPVLR